MSVVTDVILTWGLEGSRVGDAAYGIPTEINEWLTTETPENRGWGPLVQVDHMAGGGKAMQACVAIGAFNYFDEKGFVAMLATVPWQFPDAVHVFMQLEHETGFREWPIPWAARGGRG